MSLFFLSGFRQPCDLRSPARPLGQGLCGSEGNDYFSGHHYPLIRINASGQVR